MWNTMRQLPRFDTGDLEATADVSRNHAMRYVLALEAAEYLVQVKSGVRGKLGQRAIYRLIRNTGPVAPRVTANGLLDHNLTNPYGLPPHKRVTKHAHAFHKALRELLDAVGQGPNSKALGPAIKQGRDVLQAYEEDA
jgi:hypothetical protein